MELIPRITRAQSMDALSSQANLAGYRAVIIAANLLPQIFPMMITAAGTIQPAKVFIVGAGVAGLQAIATAKRLGAAVSAIDVRPEVKEQVESLGARFVMPPVQASGEGGYAKELTPEQKAQQQKMMADTVADSDVVVTTALIPGRPAPKLVTAEMVQRMRPSSVIVDLAAERGGNCELTEPGHTVVKHGVTIVGSTNAPAEVPMDASTMYAGNVVKLLQHLLGKNKDIQWNMSDEITAGVVVCREGQIVHPGVKKALGL
jgi:NAD(P) transhydrogenase subunit alpha